MNGYKTSCIPSRYQPVRRSKHCATRSRYCVMNYAMRRKPALRHQAPQRATNRIQKTRNLYCPSTQHRHRNTQHRSLRFESRCIDQQTSAEFFRYFPALQTTQLTARKPIPLRMIRIPLPPATHSHSSDLTIPNVPASASHLPSIAPQPAASVPHRRTERSQ